MTEPVIGLDVEHDDTGEYVADVALVTDMTLRDRFAIGAIHEAGTQLRATEASDASWELPSGVVLEPGCTVYDAPAHIAEVAYGIADAMLAARESTP